MLRQIEGSMGAAAGTVLVRNGQPGAFQKNESTFSFGTVSDVGTSAEILGSVQKGGDALIRLNDALLPDAVVIDVPSGLVVEHPILVVHWSDGGSFASFPRTCVRAGDGARVSVVEVFAGAEGEEQALVVPVTELAAGEGAQLSYVSVQILGPAAWSIARLSASGAARSVLNTFTVGLGGAYGRVRADIAGTGKDARSTVLSAYLGHGDQIHDVRTLQDHAAPRTTSELLCQGAVADHSRSVYSGLIRVQRGAVRSDARQTNHNLVLSEGAHADSVPNLDILENDVSCAHASTVGPIDEDQRYYIESRGVAPEVAEGLIVRGFFDAIMERGPIAEVTSFLQDEVHDRLQVVLGGRAVPAGV
jgi:Fe-S cluster assembly protein SufD